MLADARAEALRIRAAVSDHALELSKQQEGVAQQLEHIGQLLVPVAPEGPGEAATDGSSA